MGTVRMVRRVLMLAGLASVLAQGVAAQRPGAVKESPRSTISMTVTSSGREVAGEGFTEVRGVTVAVNATVPWQLSVRTEPLDSTVLVRLTDVRGPARALQRDFQPVSLGTPVASGSAGTGIELSFDYRFPVSTSRATISYVIIPE